MFLFVFTGVFALYPCNNDTTNRKNVLTTFEIIAYTDDKVYEPIVLYIPKACSDRSPGGDK